MGASLSWHWVLFNKAFTFFTCTCTHNTLISVTWQEIKLICKGKCSTKKTLILFGLYVLSCDRNFSAYHPLMEKASFYLLASRKSMRQAYDVRCLGLVLRELIFVEHFLIYNIQVFSTWKFSTKGAEIILFEGALFVLPTEVWVTEVNAGRHRSENWMNWMIFFLFQVLFHATKTDR